MHSSARVALVAIALAAALEVSPSRAAQASLVASTPARYGQPVAVELRNAPLVIQPANRYARFANGLTIDMDYSSRSFGPFPPSYGSMPVPLGELAPGTHRVEARLFDIDRPGSGPEVVMAHIEVAPPPDWGIYPVPQEPRAYQPVEALIHSAAYFEPATMRAYATGKLVRVEFDYSSVSAGSGVPAGSARSFASVALGKLAPGAYTLEAWGRLAGTASFTRFFTRQFTVRADAFVVEYYNEFLHHYFMAAGDDEITLLDGGAQGGWRRTGQQFSAWLKAADAPLNAHPVCRFYAAGPNSHFYTGDERECQLLRDQEREGRSESETLLQPFLGWSFEGIAFWALAPQFGECLAASQPVFRAYNDRAAQRDSNHRFMSDRQVRGTMTGWIDEGAVFCSLN